MLELLALLSASAALQTAPVAAGIEVGSGGMVIYGDAAPFHAEYHTGVFNRSGVPDRLLAISTPVSSDVSRPVLFVYDGNNALRPQADPRAIPPGSRALVTVDVRQLATEEFPEGVPVTLEFERAGKLTVVVAPVIARNSPPPPPASPSRR
jgi:copper(I)-binding protein